MSTTIDENALADYEALCAGATAGPWEIEREELGEDFDDEEQDTAFPMTIGPIQLWEHALDNLTDEHGAQVETDAAFIAQSRTMGPLLATKVREQAKEIERLQRLAREGWKEVQDTCDFEGVEVPGRVSAALAEIVGTEEAREAVSKLEDIANNAANDGAERQSAWDAAALLYAVLSHRDHLAAQVTELHASVVDAQERERQARTDALAYEGDRDDLTDQVRELRTDALLLATRIDESAAEDLILLDDSDREVVARILKAAGKEPRSPETRALTGEEKAVAKHTVEAPVVVHLGSEGESLDIACGLTILSMPKGEKWSSGAARVTCPICMSTEDFVRVAAASVDPVESSPDGTLWAYVVADGSGVMLLEHAPALSDYLDATKGDDVQDHLAAPGDGLWFWQGTAKWDGDFDGLWFWQGTAKWDGDFNGHEGDGAELTLEGTWTKVTVANAARHLVKCPRPKPPKPADVARWVEAIRLEPDSARTGVRAFGARRRAQNAREHLAKHNLGTNGLPLGRIS